MSSNYKPQLQQRSPKRVCIKCSKDISNYPAFSFSFCSECMSIKHEQEKKVERAMWKSYCPFCHMLLAEHKQNEAQLCLYNLRGYVTSEQQSVRSVK